MFLKVVDTITVNNFISSSSGNIYVYCRLTYFMQK